MEAAHWPPGHLPPRGLRRGLESRIGWKALGQSMTQDQTPSAGQVWVEFSWGCHLGMLYLPLSSTPMACTPDLSEFM